MKRIFVGLILIGCIWSGGPARLALAAGTDASLPIVCPAGPSSSEALAAKEIRRYIYLRTGRLLAITQGDAARAGRGGAIIVARKNRPMVADLLAEAKSKAALATLEPDQFWLKTLRLHGHPVLLLTGGDDTGTLYAAYRFCEHLGVRFYLHGDVIPDAQIPLRLPKLDERSMPLFSLRGIQPFHDFPEGPDWWTQEDYQAVIAQLPKLRMNFFGLHTYPEGGPNAEPTVWIGPPSEADEQGQVKASYSASYQNTLRGNWGYAAKETSKFSFGASELFEQDGFGSDLMLGYCPQPSKPGDDNLLFNRTAGVLKKAFTMARELGVKTCVGTETPLTVPKAVKDRLQAAGKNPADPAVLQELYQGIFQRAARSYPLDYYWFWTPEGWTWEGTKDEQVRATTNNLFAAITALKQVGNPFSLATCGWVLGPQQDRALFDKLLPKNMPVSCINREVGKTPVDKGFSEVLGRGKWAIPWMEDDPALTSPQLWAGRMRRDAADARRYGCDGLMGIHWRTRVLGPAVAALAQAAWNQDAWNQTPFEPIPMPPPPVGPNGGQIAAYLTNSIVGSPDVPLYQTVRYNLSGYHLPATNGPCKVVLKFCEPHYSAAGKRVFGVKLQGKTVIDSLDVFAKIGQNHALDYTFENVAVTNGWMDIEFVPIVEFPCIAALVVEGRGFSHKINCGGPAYKDYAADAPVAPAAKPTFPSTEDFYADWAEHEFGPEIGENAAAIFASIDGALPRPSDWIDGPGGIRPDPRRWDLVAEEYAFVDQLAALEPWVRGEGNLARFDYWVETFRYMRAMAQVNYTWATYNAAIEKVKTGKDAAEQAKLAREWALPVRRELVHLVEEVYQHLLATVSNPGEMGTVANWDQHILPSLLTKPGEELAKFLGQNLPAYAQPSQEYKGPLRVIVPTVRSSLTAGEPFQLKVIVLSDKKPSRALFWWRELGESRFSKTLLKSVGRGVYTVELPAAAAMHDFEYCVQITPEEGDPVLFPPTAPDLNQTVVVWNMAR